MNSLRIRIGTDVPPGAPHLYVVPEEEQAEPRVQETVAVVRDTTRFASAYVCPREFPELALLAKFDYLHSIGVNLQTVQPRIRYLVDADQQDNIPHYLRYLRMLYTADGSAGQKYAQGSVA